jgi:hypothetical protein
MKVIRSCASAGKRVIRRLAYKNYHSAKAYHNLSFHFSSSRRKEPLIVFQMGKVGSTTVIRSLEATGLDMSIYHAHVLTQDAMDKVEKTYKKHFSYMSLTPNHLWESQYLRKQIDKGLRAGKKWKIVTLVRDPVVRNVSAFFQNLDVELLDSNHRYRIKSTYNFETTLDIEDIGKLVELFVETLDHDTPVIWFDSQLKPVFGIDVFASDFPISKGYKIYEGELADALVLRLENLDECARDAFQEFLGLEGFTLMKANVASEKPYYIIYRRFLDSAILPDSYLAEMYTSKYAQHFYSQEEISAFRARWRRNTAPKA